MRIILKLFKNLALILIPLICCASCERGNENLENSSFVKFKGILDSAVSSNQRREITWVAPGADLTAIWVIRYSGVININAWSDVKNKVLPGFEKLPEIDSASTLSRWLSGGEWKRMDNLEIRNIYNMIRDSEESTLWIRQVKREHGEIRVIVKVFESEKEIVGLVEELGD
ncbi:MAG: hypothetical protein ABIS50_05640 [Luteolibacter sp.]|uniref:hypothetical protein n=1 Tax=Luteolibacter sp. TaxID=1962973 RepID=UPI00326688AC